jgi:hypothetical protein
VSSILAITYDGGAAVTASDTTADPAGPFAGIFTGAGGTIKLTTVKGQTLTFVSLPAGVILPVATQRVWSSTTNATSVLGLVAMPYKGTPNPS